MESLKKKARRVKHRFKVLKKETRLTKIQKIIREKKLPQSTYTNIN